MSVTPTPAASTSPRMPGSERHRLRPTSATSAGVGRPDADGRDPQDASRAMYRVRWRPPGGCREGAPSGMGEGQHGDASLLFLGCTKSLDET